MNTLYLGQAVLMEANMLKGFKDFIMRGNVIDLAIAVVVGAAFTGIVTQLTKSFIQPLIQVIGGGGIHGGAFVIHGVAFDWAAFINAIINFLIIAAALYFLIVLPLNRLNAHRHRIEAESARTPDPEDLVLLREIRDLLKEQK
jgi:large conductance mechanosensitive channel